MFESLCRKYKQDWLHFSYMLGLLHHKFEKIWHWWWWWWWRLWRQFVVPFKCPSSARHAVVWGLAISETSSPMLRCRMVRSSWKPGVTLVAMLMMTMADMIMRMTISLLMHIHSCPSFETCSSVFWTSFKCQAIWPDDLRTSCAFDISSLNERWCCVLRPPVLHNIHDSGTHPKSDMSECGRIYQARNSMFVVQLELSIIAFDFVLELECAGHHDTLLIEALLASS